MLTKWCQQLSSILTRYICLFFSLSLVSNDSRKQHEHLHYYQHHLLMTTCTNEQSISTATTSTSTTTIISITSLQPVALTSKGHNTRCLPTPLHILSLPTSTPMFVWLCPIENRIMIPNAFPLPNMSIPYPLLLSFLKISSRVWPSPSGNVPFLSFKTAKSIILAVLVDKLIIGRCDIRFTTYITGCTPPIFS